MSEFIVAIVLLLGMGHSPFILLTGEGWPHFVKASELPRTGWLGLFDGRGEAAIRPTEIVVKRADDQVTEVDSKPAGAIVMFHGVTNLKARSVRSATWDSGAALHAPGDIIAFQLGDRSYRLRLEGDSKQLSDATIVLEGSGLRQTLFSAGGVVDEPHFEVVWAGDLDGDDRLDLLLTLSPKYSYFPRQLFLSSPADSGSLVHEVARYDDYSC